MRAMRIHQFGGAEVLALEDLDIPRPDSGEILIEVAAAGVNPVDWKIREGGYPAVTEDDLPITLGRDAAGTVAEIGGEEEGLRRGDQVFAFIGSGGGGYADYVLVSKDELAAKPTSLSDVEAAAIPLAGLTAWQGLFDHGGLESRQRVLVHGGAGGVGHLAIQFAKAAGAWVATTVSADDKEFVAQLDADQVVDYKAETFEAAIDPVDLVLDLVNGQTRDRSFSVLKPGGMLVSSLGKPDEEKARAAGVRTAGYLARPDARQLREISRLIDEGKVRVEIQDELPLERAADAQREQKESHSRGKIVLNTRT